MFKNMLSIPPTGEEVTCMIKYYICDNFYHHSCMNLTVEDVKKIKTHGRVSAAKKAV